ncbi:MAG: tetratricopeptide repeat protein [Blastocatellia bacterium]
MTGTRRKREEGRPRRAARTGLRRLGIIAIVFVFGCSFNSGAAQQMSVARGRELLKSGDYKEALSVFVAVLQKNGLDRDAFEGRILCQLAVGQYEAAENRTKVHLRENPSDAGLRVLLAESYFETGRYPEADVEFDRAAGDTKPGVIWLRAKLGRVRALAAQGKVDESLAIAQEFVGYYNDNSPRSAEELTLIGRAMVHLEKFEDANDLFIDAREADPTFIDAFIAQGELLNEAYNYGDAASLFEDALKINRHSPRALIGRARSKALESIEEPSAAVDLALAVNPNFTEALELRAWLDLEAGNYESAQKAIDRALAVNANAVDVVAVRAAVFYLTDRKSELESETKRALAINPHAGEFFETLAHFAVNNRRYVDAVDFANRAVALSPRLWSARTQLGIQMLRIGRISEGRAELERVFEGDPYNVWAKNTLDLLDSMKDYSETVRGPFLLKAAPAESGALAGYVGDLLEEAYTKLTARYRFTPRAPIQVEMFPNHEDFAVRSLGLPGLGALGVCFGQVIAMDSPSARGKGEFNWGSTLWHEFTHVMTLQITDHRIPRWFSEGLSVYEERRARQGWGEDWSLDKLKAISDGRFVKIDDLDGAFTRPKSPDGVGLAYFQASQVCEFVDEKFGFEAILRMLAMYKEGARTTDVLQRALKLTPAEFDKAFTAFVKGKTAAYLEAVGSGLTRKPGEQPPPKDALLEILKTRPNDYFAHLRLGSAYKVEGDADRAIEHLKRAAELFPYYSASGNPYELMADIYESHGQRQESAAALEALTRVNETNADAFARLARLRLAMRDWKLAVEALKQCFYAQPFDATLHKLAGDAYLELGNTSEAIREFRVTIALAPPDLAEAHFDLARALEAAGNRTEARREVVRALEIAPGFEKAQELLLKLRASK